MKCEARRVLPEGEGVVTLDIYEENKGTDAEPNVVMVCAVHQLTGRLNAPPKAWLSIMRRELALIETVAKGAGCNEMRFVGRFKKRMFPDYEEYTSFDGSDGLRKAI